MRQAYYSYLLDSNQEERAAELKVREHDFLQAIKLYMKGVRSLFLPTKMVLWWYNMGWNLFVAGYARKGSAGYFG